MTTRSNVRACAGSQHGVEKKSTSFSTIIQKQKSRKQQEDADDDDDTMKSTRITCSFRMPRKRDLSPLKYFKNLGGKMVGVLRMISPRGASPKVTSSSERAKTYVAPLDSHRAEAIDDCIEFINSSSLPRSNSTAE